MRSAKPAGSSGRCPVAAVDGGRELRRVRGGERHHRHAPDQLKRAATARPTAVCGSGRNPVARQVSRDGRRGLRLVRAAGDEILADRGERAPRRSRTRRLRELVHQPPDRQRRSRPWASNSSRSKFDETWMSIDGEAVAVTPRSS